MLCTRFVLIESRSATAVGHGDAKVNCWEQPTNISNWKEEHVSVCCETRLAVVSQSNGLTLVLQIVFAVLGAWGIGIYSAFKIFGGKKESTPSAAPEQLDKH